jgi:hypothetical protein
MPRNNIASAASLRHSHEEVQTWTERLANLREDLTLRQDTSGDKFRIELDKQTLDNRGVAGELLFAAGGENQNPFGEDIRIGRFAGFDLFIRAGFNNTAELVLRGKNSYSTRVTDTALGTIRSLESMVQGFEERAARLESDIKDSQKRATELEAKVGAPFEKEERYHKLVNASRKLRSNLTSPRIRHPASRPDHAHAQQPPATLATNLTINRHNRMNVTTQQTEFLSWKVVPARLDATQTAWFLGIEPQSIQPLRRTAIRV